MTYTDIIIPKGNEQAFIEVANKIGIKSLLFLYEPKKINNEELEKIRKSNPEIKIFTGNLILKNTNQTGINFAKANLQTLEHKYITHVFDLESLEEKDNHHYRTSGMNQAIAKKIKEQNKTIVISTEQIISNKEPQRVIGRIQQNLELIKKYDLKIAIASLATKPENMRPEKETQALLKTLGYELLAKKAITEMTKQFSKK